MQFLRLDPLTLRAGDNGVWVEFNGTKIAGRFAITRDDRNYVPG